MRPIAVLVLVGAATSCGGGSDPSTAEVLCATVQAWSDATSDTVEAFRLDSRGLDATTRRARYDEAFAELQALHGRTVDAVGRLDLPVAAADRLGVALDAVASIVGDGAAQARGLPDDAFGLVAVREGKLVTSFEKARVTVYHALAELARDDATGVPAGCGRRDRRDASPSVTFPI